MAVNDPVQPKSFGEKLQSLNRTTLYLILVLGATIPAFFPFKVPNKPIEPSIAFFERVSSLQEGDSVLIETDWTKSTRGESMGHMEGLLRMLMRNKVKFAIYSCADPQAPRVARDVIERLSVENAKEGGIEYKRWDQWLDLGYFPSAEGQNASIASNVRKAFASKTELPGPGMGPQNVWKSPVLENIQKVEDFKLVIIVTASNTFNVAVERLSAKTNLLAAVTGVMVPESQVYFDSGQVKGLSGGLKGVYDMETLMQGKWPDKTNEGKAKAYYPTLHVVLAIMMLAIIIGNVGMFLAKRRSGA